MKYDLAKLNDVLKAANLAKSEATGGRVYGGCGRVYIVLMEVPRSNSKIYKLFESHGFKFRSRPYMSRKSIYMGYDNATGIEWNQAEAVAKVFKENGIDCYVDGDSD